MNFILNKAKLVYRSLSYAITPSFNSPVKSSRVTFLTAVAGHDNKHTKYKTKLSPKWRYGDDACFISQNEKFCVLGVADGVGGWRSYGVDPSSFSKRVMDSCHRIVESGKFQPSNTHMLIEEVYDDLIHVKQTISGSATMCILTLCSQSNRLYAASLGDSGFLLLRGGRIIDRSEFQKHSLNTPFQLACIPPHRSSMQFYKDSPEMAAKREIHIKEGDLIIVGTDGLFDNLTDAMILQELEIANNPPRTNEDLKLYCDRLVNKAKEAAMNRDFFSPFASEARHYGLNILGGVPGDITVILGLVIGANNNEDEGVRLQTLKISSQIPSSPAMTPQFLG